jgi:CxC6 like cysteine cluster associated with KDZ transposases
LTNARGGVFCAVHQHVYGARCRIYGCENQKVKDTEACVNHQREWKKHKLNRSQSGLAGVRRMLQRPNESQAWQSRSERIPQPHDNDEDDDIEIPRLNYFSPSRFYCVETMCAPCGVVIAWTKFDKSESPTKILTWLASVYPTEESRPAYICIDKACKVLRTCIRNGSWEMWKKTSRFIVDSYHYINHRTTDYMCRKWCNPAPLNGSAPNLVVLASDKRGRLYYKRAFNTQVCGIFN